MDVVLNCKVVVKNFKFLFLLIDEHKFYINYQSCYWIVRYGGDFILDVELNLHDFTFCWKWVYFVFMGITFKCRSVLIIMLKFTTRNRSVGHFYKCFDYATFIIYDQLNHIKSKEEEWHATCWWPADYYYLLNSYSIFPKFNKFFI